MKIKFKITNQLHRDRQHTFFYRFNIIHMLMLYVFVDSSAVVVCVHSVCCTCFVSVVMNNKTCIHIHVLNRQNIKRHNHTLHSSYAFHCVIWRVNVTIWIERNQQKCSVRLEWNFIELKKVHRIKWMNETE